MATHTDPRDPASKNFAGFTRRLRLPAPAAPLTGSRASNTDVPIGWCLLAADDDDSLSVLTELADAAPRVTQGYGGWDEVERPKRTSLTTWRGFKPVIVELDLFIDDYDAGRSVEPAIDILEALAGRGRRATGGQPPKVIANTAGVMPHDSHEDTNNRWVINGLDWDQDAQIVNSHGNRVRASVTVTLLQYVADDRLQDRALAVRQALQSRGSAKKRYTVKSGETLITIARKQLHDAGRWTEIASLNNIRDPRAVKPGAQIRLP